MRERERELARRRRRHVKVAKLMRRLDGAHTRDQREKIVAKLMRQAPWRYQEFQRRIP